MPKLEALQNYVDLHKFRAGFVLDSDTSDSDFSEVSVHGWNRLHLVFDFTGTMATADTDILTIELHQSSTTTDTDFAAVGTDSFSLAISPADDSDNPHGIEQVDIGLLGLGVTKQFVRPDFSLAGGGTSISGTNVYGILYNGQGVLDHETADTNVLTVT